MLSVHFASFLTSVSRQLPSPSYTIAVPLVLLCVESFIICMMDFEYIECDEFDPRDPDYDIREGFRTVEDARAYYSVRANNHRSLPIESLPAVKWMKTASPIADELVTVRADEFEYTHDNQFTAEMRWPIPLGTEGRVSANTAALVFAEGHLLGHLVRVAAKLGLELAVDCGLLILSFYLGVIGEAAIRHRELELSGDFEDPPFGDDQYAKYRNSILAVYVYMVRVDCRGYVPCTLIRLRFVSV